MKNDSVTEQAIRLAYKRPDLRPKILSTFLRAKRAASQKVAFGLRPGNGFEDEKRMLRFHRYMDSIRVTDLTNAGKRGKKVDKFAVTGLDMIPDADELVSKIVSSRTYKEALKVAKEWVDDVRTHSVAVHLYETQDRGVDVTPAGFSPIKLDGKNVVIEAEYGSFTVRDKVDKNNLPTCIPAIKGGKKDIKVFYRWVKDNQSKLKNMTFLEIVRAMSKEGIKFHQYCAMD